MRERVRDRAAGAVPGALRCMLHGSRALRRYPVRPQHTRVRVPTVILWGEQDGALHRALVEPGRALCDDGRLVVMRAAHWPRAEAPAPVTHLLLTL